MLRRARSGLLALALDLLLLGLGFLTGMATDRIRFDQQRPMVPKRGDAALRRWRDFSEHAGRKALAEREANGPPWADHVHQMDEALKQRDVSAAERAWHEAYSAVLRNRRWEGMLEVGDAYVRIGEVARGRRIAEAKARRLYLGALFLAREQRSIDGVLRTAEAFANLGDREIVTQAIRIAEELAVQAPDQQARARVRTVAERLTNRFLDTRDSDTNPY